MTAHPNYARQSDLPFATHSTHVQIANGKALPAGSPEAGVTVSIPLISDQSAIAVHCDTFAAQIVNSIPAEEVPADE